MILPALLSHLVATAVIVPSELKLRERGAGIIDFELAGTPERAREIIDGWGADGVRAARQNLIADVPYLASYGWLGHSLVRRANQRSGRTDVLARAAEWLPVAAGALDAVEGVALWRVLEGDLSQARAARAASLTKFGCLGLAAGHALWQLRPGARQD